MEMKVQGSVCWIAGIEIWAVLNYEWFLALVKHVLRGPHSAAPAGFLSFKAPASLAAIYSHDHTLLKMYEAVLQIAEMFICFIDMFAFYFQNWPIMRKMSTERYTSTTPTGKFNIQALVTFLITALLSVGISRTLLYNQRLDHL